MFSPKSVRLDKWLWAVRIYPSRSLAAAACNTGRVRIAGLKAKPSRDVRPGEVIVAVTGLVRRTLKVVAPLDQRVRAKAVNQFLEDLTPPEEFARARENARPPTFHFPKGFGRPTKKQRRQLEKLSS